MDNGSFKCLCIVLCFQFTQIVKGKFLNHIGKEIKRSIPLIFDLIIYSLFSFLFKADHSMVLYHKMAMTAVTWTA